MAQGFVRSVLYRGNMPRAPRERDVATANVMTCTTCGRVYEYDRQRGHTRVRCNSCGGNRASRAARQALKRWMVEYKGGCCCSCGFKSSVAALSFHHRDPAKKAFAIAGNHGRSVRALTEELDKCVLLCLNCHFESHARDEPLEPRPRLQRHRPVSDKDKLCRCGVCGREYVHDWRKGHTRRVCNSCRSNRGGRMARQELKRRLVETMGGSCTRCGYSRCLRALCFHHVDETSKHFSFAGNHLRSWQALTAELEKCVLLCQNCHVIVHDEAAEMRTRLRAARLNALERELCQVEARARSRRSPPAPHSG